MPYIEMPKARTRKTAISERSEDPERMRRVAARQSVIPNALTRKTAIWPRVTLDLGQ